MNILHFGFRREFSFILLLFIICLLITNVNCDNYPINDSFINGASDHETSPSIETINSEEIIILEPIYPGGAGYSCRCAYDTSQTPPTPCLQDQGAPTFTINTPGSYILGKDAINKGSNIQIKAPNVHFDGNGETKSVNIFVDSSNTTITNIYNGDKIYSSGINTTILENNCKTIFCEGPNPVIKDNSLSGSGDGIKTTGEHSTILRNNLHGSGRTHAILAYGSETIILKNNVSLSYNAGIGSYGDNSLIMNNDVSRSLWQGIGTSGSNTTIQNNFISNTWGWGILATGADNIIFNNRVNNSTFYGGGISVEGINAKIQNNTLHFNTEGILSNGSNHIISGNLVNDMYSDVSSRIYSEDSKNNWSIANKSSQNVTNDDFFWYYGIGILGSNSTLINNKISNFNQEIWIKGQNNTIYNNYISNDWYGGHIDEGANNIWTNPEGPLPGTNIMGGPYIAGNYWSLPKGKGWSDLQPPNPKGYTTTPYEVSLGVYDTAPLVKVNTSSHIIEASAGDGGKIEPSGSVYVEHGENVTFTFIPDKSYQTANFTIDGNYANNTSPFTFTDVKTDHTIEANFSKTPVVLVHGFNSDPSCWTEMIKSLNKEGIETWAFDYSDNNRGDPRVIAHQFKAFIENKRDKTHYYGPIDIVCHSMGALVSRWEMENLENGDANVRQWIGIAPVTGGSALADDEDGLLIFRAFLNLIGIFDPGSALAQLSTNSDTVKILNNNINKNQLNKNTIYRVIVGYNPDASIFFNNLLFAVTRQKINDVYSWTFLGDGIVANTQSYFHNVGEQFDALPIMGIYWDHEEASSYNHQKICHQQETINHVVSYYQNPQKSSTNILPNEPTGVKPNLIIKTWETAKITANAYTIFRFPVIGATLLTICCTGDGNNDIKTLKDSNLLSEKVNITITYKSGKSIKLTPDTAYYQSDSNNLTCFIDPDEVGEYTVTVSPLGLQPYGFNGEMKINGITSNYLIPINEIIPSSGINSESTTITNLSGNNFHSGAIINLSRFGYSNITATNAQYPSSTKISCTLPIIGASPGLWNVTVTNPDGQMGTLINGFTITKTSTLNPIHAGSIVDSQGEAKLFGPHGVFVKDNYAYVVGTSNALEIIDISTPENPVHTGYIVNGTNGALLDNPYNVFTSGNYAYVISTGSNALEIIDVSNPTNPVHKGCIKDGEGGAKLNEPYSVYVSGNNAYVASKGSNALEIVDISNPEKPIHTGSITDGEGGAKLNGAFSVFVSGNYAYIASSSSNALEIIDVSNPVNPVHKGCISDGEGGARINNPQCVFVSNNFAYVVSSGSNALEIIDIKNPVNPIHKGCISDGEGGALLYNPVSVYSIGNYAYIASSFSDALEIIDIFDPENPVHAGSIVNGTRGALLDKPWSVSVSRNYTYVASYGSNALEVVNIGAASPIITSITPSSGENSNPINIPNLEGSGFQTGALVKLSRTGYSDIIANTVSIKSPSHITCTLPITGASPGLWNVTVTNPDGQMGTLINGFTITNVNPTPTVTPTPITTGYYINSTSDKWTINYPSGNKTYPEESNQTFITQSKPGADLLDVIVDEQSKEANKSYTFNNITSDHSIQTVGDATPHQVHVLFNATPCTGKLPLRVEFFDESLGEPNTWYWQFGDGQTSSFRNPIHNYTRPGIYTVSLRAYNNVSGGMGVMNEMIRVKE